MSKQIIKDTLQEIENEKYVWSMYFFKIDRRNMNPYTVYKVRFKNAGYLPQYAVSLAHMINKFQLEKIDEIHEYTGENTKVSCDRLAVNNELLKENWEYLVADVAEASDERAKEKYSGYILEGNLVGETENKKSVILVKVANPVINLTNKRSVVFSFDEKQELASITDDVCRLYMDIDFMVFGGNMYTFNYKFEDMFHIEKTMRKIKQSAINELSEIDAFSNKDAFLAIAQSYKSPRTFITLNDERVDKIKEKAKRENIAKMLAINLDEDGKFAFNKPEEVYMLIKYLCFKIFKDGETDDLLEANNVSKVIV